jgi:dTDP-4-amino-4,6-dideoxygalactose transaminase
MVMHYGGHPCDMDHIEALAARYGLPVIEDACHGPLVQHRGRMLGTIGTVGCFSFFSNKNMTTGEGGMLVTSSSALAERAKVLRSHGMTASSYERFKGHAFGYDVTDLGYNYRLDEMRAAIGLAQLAKMPAHNTARRRCVDYYRHCLTKVAQPVATPFDDSRDSGGEHIFPVLLPEGSSRAEVMAGMARHGVQTSIHYRPIHTFTAYRSSVARVPRTDAIAERILSLPLYPTLAEAQMDLVLRSLDNSL